MNELVQHIENLLLENDCVVVPGLGGFIAHYTSAEWIEEENLFLSPMRSVGFNSQLKMNDGVLVQSYMATYSTSFSDATRLIEEDVNLILEILHKEGVYELPNVGTLHYSMHENYTFTSYDYKLETPYLYGLDNFEMPTLKVLDSSTSRKVVALSSRSRRSIKLPYSTFKRDFSYISNVAAIVAVVVLSFLLSSPVKNTEVLELNSAQLFPEELFMQISSYSLTTSSVAISDEIVTSEIMSLDANVDTNLQNVEEVNMMTPEEVNVETSEKIESTPIMAKKYHIIVASVGSEKDAHLMAQQLISEGHVEARAIILDGKKRVSIVSCMTYNEAVQCLEVVNSTGKYKGAWVLKKTI